MKNKLHVLFLCSWYPSRILPTNGDFIQRHAEAVALQHKVTVVHVKTDPDLKESVEISDTVINGIRTLIAYTRPTKNPLRKWNRFVKAYFTLVKKAGDFDIIHVNKLYPAGFIARLIKRKKGISYIITEHHTLYHSPYNKKIGFLEKRLSKRITKDADFVCPVSDNLGEAMQKFGLQGKYTKVPNVVDTTVFKAKKSKAKKFTLLHVSSMAKVKNIEGILRVIKQLETKCDSFIFYLIGANAEDFKTHAEKLAINLNNIVFINQVPHGEIAGYFQQADVFVLFSDVENLPCVILESFACGTPVISTKVGGIAEYFPKNYGLLIPPRKEDELLEAILTMKTDFKTETPTKMHAYVGEHFSKEAICKAFTDLYNQSLKQA